MEDKLKKNLEMRGVEPRTFIMHRLTVYQLSYIPHFLLVLQNKYFYIFSIDEDKYKNILLEMRGVEPHLYHA